ncbi:hypothetical protein [Heyndrickxia acidiproducens]|uniref:hypothetical protein n=1 Tax=Heyndrickxia acidiproducens TaxID=1121084 RepID=UPI000380932E|nr:hypothetical protein [Heyndrickxia acidiproducens]
MALSKHYSKIVFGQEINFENAYFQITYFSGLKEVALQLTVYDSSAKENVIDQLTFSFIPGYSNSAKNILIQGYEYLKTLNEFENSIDVLEGGV